MANTNLARKGREDEIHLRDYLDVIKKRYRSIVLFFGFTVLLGVLLTFYQTPLYLASTKLLVEQSEPELMLTNFSPGLINDTHFLNSQIELLKSKNVIDAVVAKIKENTVVFNSFVREGTLGSLLRRVTTSGKSAEKDNKLYNNTKKIKEILMRDIQVDLIRDSNVIAISFMHHNPLIAQKVVDEVTQAYIDELLDIKVSSSNYTLSWLTAKADEERKKLETLEKKLHGYMRENKIITIEGKLASTPELLTDYSTQLSQAKAKRKNLEEIYHQARQFADNDDALESVPVFASNETLQQLRSDILKLEQELAEKSRNFGEKHPVIVKLGEELALLKKEKQAEIRRLLVEVKNQYDLSCKTVENLENLLEETKSNALAINEKLVEYNILKREVDTSHTLFDALIKGIKEQNVTGRTKNVNVHVLEKVEVPDRPAKPRKAVNLAVSLIVGLFGGILFAFFQEYLDDKVASKEQIEKLYNIRVIGEVERVDDKVPFIETLNNPNAYFSIAESYRMIRSAIKLSSASNPVKTLLITSAGKNEGKTSTCINLATVIALDQKKVVVIDCDMRNPSLHHYLGVANGSGLSSYLAGITSEEVVVAIPEKHISIIPAGPIPPNPSELLGSARMKDLLETLEGRFDYVLIDSPPMLAVTDADILTTVADGTILVTRAGATTYTMISATLAKMELLKTNLIGVLLNGKKRLQRGNTGYYYGHARQDSQG